MSYDTITGVVLMHAEHALRDAENLEDRAKISYMEAKENRRRAQANLDRVRRLAAAPPARVESPHEREA